jgi:hypothetical protein
MYKGKIIPLHSYMRNGGKAPIIFTLDTTRMYVVNSRPSRSTSAKGSCRVRLIECWLSPRIGLDVLEEKKNFTCKQGKCALKHGVLLNFWCSLVCFLIVRNFTGVE